MALSKSISDTRPFYLVAAQGANDPAKSIYGPPTLPYVDSLQAALTQQTAESGEDPIEVVPMETADFIGLLGTLPDASREALEPFVMWPYYRAKPGDSDVDQDVFAHLPDGVPADAVLNDARDPRYSLGDKMVNYRWAEECGVAIPGTVELSIVEDLDDLPFSYPLVIKGHPSGRGLDVKLCGNVEEAREAFEACKIKGLEVLAQEYVEESHGRDLRVLVAGGEIALILGRQGGEGEFLSNVSNGGRYFEHKLSPEDLVTINKVIEAFPVDIAGIDFLFSEDGLLFTEINSAPGWSGLAEGMAEFLAKLIRKRFDMLSRLNALEIEGL
jgi:hypothetical protein